MFFFFKAPGSIFPVWKLYKLSLLLVIVIHFGGNGLTMSVWPLCLLALLSDRCIHFEVQGFLQRK